MNRVPKHLSSVASYPRLDLALSVLSIEKNLMNGSQMAIGTRLRMDTESDQRPNIPGSMPFHFYSQRVTRCFFSPMLHRALN